MGQEMVIHRTEDIETWLAQLEQTQFRAQIDAFQVTGRNVGAAENHFEQRLGLC